MPIGAVIVSTIKYRQSQTAWKTREPKYNELKLMLINRSWYARPSACHVELLISWRRIYLWHTWRAGRHMGSTQTGGFD